MKKLAATAAFIVFACALLAGPAPAAMSDADFLELCGKGSLQQIVDAIKDGANVHALDKHGRTALMMAACKNPNPEVIPALAKAGVDINAKDSTGRTALMWAADSPSYRPPSEAITHLSEVITTLLNFGADPKAKDNNGKRAIDYARKNSRLEGSDALKKLEEASR